jgi:lysozyme
VQINPRTAVAAFVLAAGLAGGIAATSEGNPRTSYMDNLPSNPTPTACRGHTGKDVEVGKVYSLAQCDAWFRADLLKAAKGVQGCVTAPMAPNAFAGYTSLTYNIGITAFCRSSVARKANAGDRAGSCRAISLYVYAGGHKLAGLVRRRAAERALCEKP